jgi:hypothetical protein
MTGAGARRARDRGALPPVERTTDISRNRPGMEKERGWR